MELQLTRKSFNFSPGSREKSTKWDYNKNKPQGREQEVQDPLGKNIGQKASLVSTPAKDGFTRDNGSTCLSSRAVEQLMNLARASKEN